LFLGGGGGKIRSRRRKGRKEREGRKERRTRKNMKEGKEETHAV
jgi:hypothetical protein